MNNDQTKMSYWFNKCVENGSIWIKFQQDKGVYYVKLRNAYRSKYEEYDIEQGRTNGMWFHATNETDHIWFIFDYDAPLWIYCGVVPSPRNKIEAISFTKPYTGGNGYDIKINYREISCLKF